jgi:trans-AT polyketide synthase/acyltransferase/oxidoreductase domain-containing protein
MENSYIFLFSGQGSQYYHMGSEFFGKEPVFTTWMKKLDSLVYEMTGQSVLDRLYSPELKRTDKFDSIQFTHPAIFMVEYSLAQSLMENGVKPDYVLGASLGEFAAAALAGVMSVEDIMECIVKQAQVFAKYCHEGGMMAVMCEPAVFDSTPILYENSELVSINYHSHFVIASDNAKLHKIAGYLKNEGILSHKLPVSFAFHSSHIEAAKEPYIRFLRTKSNTRPRIPFVSSLYGKKIDSLQENYFWDIVRGPIKFTAALKQLEEGTDGSRVYVDLGPSGTLSNFAKYNLRAGSESSCIALMDPLKRDMEGFEKVRRLLKNKKSFSSERKVINMRAYVFPGQGSQQKGMGKGLFAEFSDYTAAADKILGYSIERLCIEDPENQLGQTQFTQPALYVVNALSYLKKVAETGEKPDYVAGHSLGEYDALFAAGVFDFETGLKIVKKRGELMSQARNGGMAAVMGMSEEKIKEVLKDNNLESIDVANFNTPSQIVISGPKDDILKAQPAFEKAGAARYIPLAVSGAFHSRYMSSAKNEFSEFISQFEFSEATIPVVSNYTARPYKRTEVLRNMVEQITGSVKWCETIRYLMGKGDISIEQVGPGSALTGMIRAIQKEAQPLIVVDEDRDDEIPEEKAPV